MKSYATLISIIVIFLFCASCKKAPTACFSVNNGGQAVLNEDVDFDASCSLDAESYTWDFDDGTTGSGKTVKHKFTTSGYFSVRLVAHNGNKTDPVSRMVAVF
jgi:PKD repeat protein